MSPYEVLFQEPPDYKQIKPFGCLAFTSNIVPHKSKFDTISIKSIFIGYDTTHKGFLLYDLDNSKVFISRDVKFVTNTFPFITPSPINSEPNKSIPSIPPNPTDDSSTPVEEVKIVKLSSNTPDDVPLADDVGGPSTTTHIPRLPPTVEKKHQIQTTTSVDE